MVKIETVIFDAGGVLHQSNTAVTTDLMSELGIDKQALKQIWAEQIPLLGSGKINEGEFWQLVQENHNIRQVSVNENLLGRAFAESLLPFEDVKRVVKELRLKGVQTAVLSNTIEPHARALYEAGVYDDFTGPIMLSHEIGLLKPDEAIYQHALERVGAAPGATIFVDDDRENVSVATSLGVNGIVFENPRQLLDDLQKFIPELGRE